jgi:FkbM family methyltransferase
MSSTVCWPYLPIVKGTLKGKKWLLSAGGKILRLMFSSYEPEQTCMFEKLIKPGNVVFDVGAHAGYYTLLSSVLVGPEGKVIAFEPNPDNYHHLDKHVKINRAENVALIECAVGDENGSGTGHLSNEGSFKVQTVRLDDIVMEKGVSPDFIKIDTEGAEMLVLTGAKLMITDKKPVIFLSTHGEEVHRKCCSFLHDMDYRLEPIIGKDVQTARELVCYPLYFKAPIINSECD